MRDASRYQRLLRLFFPAEVVRRHGEEMEATFLRLLDLERSRRGRLGAAAAWLRAVADGIWNGWLRRRGRASGVTRAGRWSGAGISWLDVKLGLRMLVKYPGMTAVSVFALAIAIPAGLGPMHVVNAVLAPLPEDESGRIRALRNFNVATRRGEASSLRTFAQWREELTAFDVLGAVTMRAAYNVISEDGRAAPVQSAEVTASTFDILQVPPLLGRTLIAADEVIGAPAVALMGYDLS